MSKDSEAGGIGYGSIPSVEEANAPAPEASLKKALIAEIFGTCTLVQVGCGGVCVYIYVGVMRGLWPAAAIWALGATLAVYATASISGGHLNPAVSLAFALVRPGDFPLKKLLPYWGAQIIGAIIAGVFNLLLFHTAIEGYETKNEITRGNAESIKSAVGFGLYWSLSPSIARGVHACFVEAFGTAFLVFNIFAATNAKNKVPAAAVAPIVGISIGMMIALLGALTGAGINPARDLGPRLVTLCAGWKSAAMTNVWVYIIGPLIGGPIGALLADKVLYM